jgi:hypothetical protein
VHRLLAPALLLAVAIGCSGDDDGGGDGDQRAAATSTTSAEPCTTPPTASGGAPAEVVATAGGLQLAIVDQGASVDVVAIFHGCPPEPVLIGGSRAAFPVGGTVTHGDGLACDEDGGVTVRSATSDDGATYQAVAKTYRLDGDELVLVDESASTIDANEDPDALRAHYEIDC